MMQSQGNGSNGTGSVRWYPVLDDVGARYDQAVHQAQDLSVVVAGLDGFRMVNDYVGPIEGDELLAAFAASVRGRVEHVVHLGGDQLLGVLSGVDAPAAVTLAEAVRQDVAGSMMTAIGRLTASIGVASYPDSVQSAQEIVYGAQAAMYWSKANGGNRVSYWGDAIGAGGWKGPSSTVEPVAALAAALERKTRAGSGQLARSAWYAAKVSTEMGIEPQEQQLIEKASLLHDVGKLAVPDEILQRPGPLTEEEKAIVRAHPALGAEIVSRLPELAGAAPIIAHHHEHFDGSGYPDALAGDAIPLGSRIILVSDAFDAMTTYRSYKSVVSLQEAIRELHNCSGQQFDRRVVDAFVAMVSRHGLNAIHWSQSGRQTNRT